MRKIIKLIRFILLVSILVLFFSCKPKNEKPAEVDLSQYPSVTIDVWDFERDKATEDWLREAFKSFETNNPGVKVRYKNLKYTKGLEELDRMVISGTPPDIVTNALKFFYVEQNFLETFNPFFNKEEIDDFFEPALSTCRYRDKIYGLPWYTTAYVMFLNLDLFEERKVNPPKNGKWSYREFIKKMRRLTFDKDGDGQIDVFGVGYDIQGGSFKPWGFIYSEGARILDKNAETCIINSAEAGKGVMRLIEMQSIYKVALPTPIELTPKDVWDSFVYKRNIAVTCEPCWHINLLRAYNEELKENNKRFKKEKQLDKITPLLNFTVAMFPTGSSGIIQLASAGVGNFILFKQKDSYKREKCVNLIKFIISPENQREALPLNGLFPSRQSTGFLYNNDPILNGIQQYIPLALIPPLHPEWKKISAILNTELRRILKQTKYDDKGRQVPLRIQEVTEILAYSKIKIDVILEELRKKEIEEKLKVKKNTN